MIHFHHCRTLLITGLLGLFFSPLTLSAESVALEPKVQAFASEVASRHNLKLDEIAQILAQADNLEELIRSKFKHSAEATWPWYRYRKNFLSSKRVKNGLKFWDSHAALFEQAEKEFGIAQEVLAAIVGVETNYGKRPGKIRVLDSLYTQAFHYPEREKFGRAQLEDFLVLAIKEKLDPLDVKGSYAGAMGQPQFIPSSYRNYAVDLDGDGRRDLWDSNADVIGSVANYFARHGWLAGAPVAAPATGVSPDLTALITQENTKPKPPKIKIAELKKAKIKIAENFSDDLLASLIQLSSSKKENEYWVGLHNFYVITRYNHSNLYAMAVYQLSQEILALRQAQQNK